MSGTRVALLSLEPWDQVWRRNQHLAARIARRPDVESVLFVTPPAGGLALRRTRSRPQERVEVRTPPLVVPRRMGGHRVLAAWTRHAVRGAEVLWVNDPVAGAAALRPGIPAVYDVTDDWRSMAQTGAERARVVAAEDLLARRARTVVCSAVLAERWADRYGVRATVIGNGADTAVLHEAPRHALPGRGPHVLYAGTLHANRLDIGLVAELAQSATVHLLGPDHLYTADRARLLRAGVRVHGAVPAAQVASWLVSADVLVCPHRVDAFTLSLDAIKSHEYLATDRPVVATPSSGFQSLHAPGLTVVDRAGFSSAVSTAAVAGAVAGRAPVATWDERAAEFAAVLLHAGGAQ